MDKSSVRDELITNLELDKGNGKRKYLKILILVVFLLIVSFIAMSMIRGKGRETGSMFKVQEISLGDLIITVSATGSLKPRNQVDVGSELSGIVKSVNVDFNDRVTKDQELAVLDASKLEAQVKQSKASLEAAEANLMDARASVRQAERELERLQRVWEMSEKRVPSQHEMDIAEITLQRAFAAEASARAQVSQSRAILEANETDLHKMVIRSPVDGIVLDRNVEEGQTVAASFQAPVLFTLAEDLSKMELSVSVDEADVGLVREHQQAKFSVDAYHEQTFDAVISRIKFAADTSEGIVTYETLLLVDNEDLLLRPGMTATAEIIVDNVDNGLLVPNSALRFQPPSMEGSGASSGNQRGMMGGMMPGPPPMSVTEPQKPEELNNKNRTVWVLRDNRPAPVDITVGLTDGNMTEVTGGGLKPGMNIITGMAGR